MKHPLRNTRLARKLWQRITDSGFNLDYPKDQVAIRRTYAGHWMRAAGAFTWELTNLEGRSARLFSVGSQWTATECARSKHLVVQNEGFNGGLTIYPETGPDLPDKASDLIRVAIAAARNLDRKIYNPYWGDWHAADLQTNRCTVCFAGAMIAGVLGRAPTETLTPGILSSETTNKLHALDHFRAGEFVEALISLGTPEDLARAALSVPIPLWGHFDSWQEFDKFLDEMTILAGYLGSIGL